MQSKSEIFFFLYISLLAHFSVDRTSTVDSVHQLKWYWILVSTFRSPLQYLKVKEPVTILEYMKDFSVMIPHKFIGGYEHLTRILVPTYKSIWYHKPVDQHGCLQCHDKRKSTTNPHICLEKLRKTIKATVRTANTGKDSNQILFELKLNTLHPHTWYWHATLNSKFMFEET